MEGFYKKGIIICGFAGIGKSSIQKHSDLYTTIKYYDLQSHNFVKHPGWEKSYIDCACSLAKENDYVFVSTHDVVIKELMNRDVKFYIVYPYRYCKDEYMERFKQRGSDMEYIKRFMLRWDMFVNNIENLTHVNKIPLRRGQYLTDVLYRIR